VLGVGCWVLGVGCWVLGVGCWVLGVGCWVLGVGYPIEDHPLAHHREPYALEAWILEI